MKTEALITMLSAVGTVTAVTGYFFYLVLSTPPKQEPDSYEDNDEELVRQND
ncbi:hypothetical protein [Flavobacterium sasangense]|jgi:hypothetical protein|uniref:hypothetical protein n=1 Tax=Flavobacterium sasangense TaxID=503361 RepID=UPI000A535952|nr:hypothetical protein [Flavobacterium sasangense]